ncbi:MAG: hypothetical protein HYU67_03690 [Flavobacteriia bacterium]|nr:hypothetical protein [Flavobacteriia bacterium]
MKKLSLLIFVAFFCFLSYSQKNAQKKPKEHFEHMAKHLTKELNLTGKQSKELHALLKKSFDEADLVRSNPTIPKEEKKQKLTDIYSQREKNIKSILNDAQKVKFVQIKEEKKKAHNSK